jgi:hypothetical protein
MLPATAPDVERLGSREAWLELPLVDHDAIYFAMCIEQPPAFSAVIVGRVEKPAIDPVLRGVPRLGSSENPDATVEWRLVSPLTQTI